MQIRYDNLDQTLQQERKEFDRLFGLYNDFPWENVEFIYGYVIRATADPSQNELTIDCRGTYGLQTGQYVMARNNSIIGTISDIFPQIGKAKVKLITNTDSKIPVQIAGINQMLQMQGNGDNTAKISMVSTKTEIRKGLDVYILRQAGFLDANMKVGTILDFKPNDKQPLIWDITVKPAWELEEIDEIAVIVINTPIE